MNKIIDEQGKLFGLINLFDLGLIIILLLLGIKVLSDYRPAPLDLSERQVAVGLAVKNVPAYLADNIKVGQDLFLDGSNIYLGKIYTKRVGPAEILVTENGKIVVAESPRNVDLRLELKKKGRLVTGPARAGVYFNNFAVRVGDPLKAHTLFASFQGEIDLLRVEK